MRNFVKDLFSKSEVNAIGAARGPVGKNFFSCINFLFVYLIFCKQNFPKLLKILPSNAHKRSKTVFRFETLKEQFKKEIALQQRRYKQVVQ